MCLDVKVSLRITRTNSKAVSENNGPVPHDESWFSEPTIADIHRLLKQGLDQMDKHLRTLTAEMKRTNQRLAGVQHQA